MSFFRRTWFWAVPLVLVATVVYTIQRCSVKETLRLDTIYGSIEITDPCLQELIQCRAVQRLRRVHQYGMLPYATPIEPYSRYDHSIGILTLLKQHNCSIEEQLAGLLQDVSHTAFSHLANFVFDIDIHGHAYHEDIHLWYLRHSGIADILERYGYQVEDIHPENGHFPILKQPLPGLSINRIEYNLQGGFRRGLLSQKEVSSIQSDLFYEAPHWYFTHPESARKLAQVSLHMTENLWGSAWVLLLCTWASEVVKYAIEQDLITFEEFHFSHDEKLWHRLLDSDDPYISERMKWVQNFDQLYTCCKQCDKHTEHDLVLSGKFRGVNPLVVTEGGLKPLSEIDPDYRREYNKVKEIMKRGWSLNLIDRTKEKLILEKKPLLSTEPISL